MLRLSELRLPLDHPEDALRGAVLRRLGVGGADLLGVSVARRGYDARKPAAISLVYTLDLELRDEAAVLPAQRRAPWHAGDGRCPGAFCKTSPSPSCQRLA